MTDVSGTLSANWILQKLAAADQQAFLDRLQLVPLRFNEPIFEVGATLSHVYFDISWDEVAKYAVASPQAIANTVAIFNKYPDRILFGTDNVAPPDQATQLRVYQMWDPIWQQLTPAASQNIRLGNYERLFNAARARVRAWESANLK